MCFEMSEDVKRVEYGHKVVVIVLRQNNFELE